MNQRFQNEEIRHVSEQYAENELYKAVSSIGHQLENELKGFGLCPEECFMETLELLSVIAEKGEDILPEIDNLWLRKENEYRRHDRQVDEYEIRKSVGIVFGFTILAIDSSRHPFYRLTLSELLMQAVANHKWDGWSTTLGQIFEVPLPDGWFDDFVNEEFEDSSDIDTEYINNTYIQKAIKMGILDNKGKPKGLTTAKKGRLAYLLARYMNVSNTWKYFGEKWGVDSEILRSYMNTQNKTADEWINSLKL